MKSRYSCETVSVYVILTCSSQIWLASSKVKSTEWRKFLGEIQWNLGCHGSDFSFWSAYPKTSINKSSDRSQRDAEIGKACTKIYNNKPVDDFIVMSRVCYLLTTIIKSTADNWNSESIQTHILTLPVSTTKWEPVFLAARHFVHDSACNKHCEHQKRTRRKEIILQEYFRAGSTTSAEN